MQGLLDWVKTPEGQGLLSAAFGGLANARRGAPLNSIGGAGMAGLMGYSGALERQDQLAERAKMNEFRGVQMDAYKAKAAAEAEALARERAKQAALPGLFKPPTMTGGEAVPQMLGDVPMFSKPMGVTPMRQSPGGFDVLGAVLAGFKPEEIQKYAELPNAGRAKVARTVKGMGPDGREFEYQVDEFGQRVGDGLAQYRAPIQADTGGAISWRDAYDPTKVVASADKTMTPGEVSSRETTMRGQNLTNSLGWANNTLARERLTFDQGGGGEFGGSQAALVKQFGKPSAGYRWKPDGSQEFIPGGPADQKAQLQKSGEGTVGSVVANLRDRYAVLQQNGGIVSTGNGALANIGARLGSTGVGQSLGGAVGTTNQSARESIAMTRPLLLQAIMKATGMSAKQMDSNAELKLYLATATDPTLGYEANMRALDQIETLYGGGSNGPSGNTGGATGDWGGGSKVLSLSDIAATAKASGKTAAEVTAAARAKGYTIGGR